MLNLEELMNDRYSALFVLSEGVDRKGSSDEQIRQRLGDEDYGHVDNASVIGSVQIIQQEFRKLCEGPWSLMMNDIVSPDCFLRE